VSPSNPTSHLDIDTNSMHSYDTLNQNNLVAYDLGAGEFDGIFIFSRPEVLKMSTLDHLIGYGDGRVHHESGARRHLQIVRHL
jgi:hypothetical protein